MFQKTLYLSALIINKGATYNHKQYFVNTIFIHKQNGLLQKENEKWDS